MYIKKRMDNKKNILYNNKKPNKNQILVPHNTQLNNFKSNKYFTCNQNPNINPMKEALIKYREKQQQNDKNETTTKNQSSNISTLAISDINTKKRFNKNNSIKLDKTLLNYAEPRTKLKEFHKIQPKIIDSFISDSVDNIDTFFENEYNQENIENNNI